MLGHGHKARNYVLGMQNNYQNDLVGCGGHRKVKGQSQEGKVKGSLQEEEDLGATGKQTKCVMCHFAGAGPEWASISSCVHGQHDTAILTTPATQINVRMSTLFPFLNYRGTGATEAWKVLRAPMTNLGQMGSGSESKNTDGALRSTFLANQKTHTRQMAKWLKKQSKLRSLGSSGNKGANQGKQQVD